jgi:hypothetical protein
MAQNHQRGGNIMSAANLMFQNALDFRSMFSRSKVRKDVKTALHKAQRRQGKQELQTRLAEDMTSKSLDEMSPSELESYADSLLLNADEDNFDGNIPYRNPLVVSDNDDPSALPLELEAGLPSYLVRLVKACETSFDALQLFEVKEKHSAQKRFAVSVEDDGEFAID